MYSSSITSDISMQVFMPFPSFQESVNCLDKSRLGNQIWREAKTLLTGGWSHHPAAKLWENHKPALATYCLAGLKSLLKNNWISPNSYNLHYFTFLEYIDHNNPKPEMPPFIGNERFHLSHRLNLLWKLPSHYSKYFTEPVPTSKPEYYWPLHLLER